MDFTFLLGLLNKNLRGKKGQRKDSRTIRSSSNSADYTENSHHYFSDYLHFLEHGKNENVSLHIILLYNLKFLILIGFFLLISYITSAFIHESLRTTHPIATEILMIPLFFMASAFMIPHIRSKEKIQGVRLNMLGSALVVLLLVLIVSSTGNLTFISKLFIPISSYILLTFMFCPEVIGISGNIVDWFKKGRQVRIMILYVAVVCLYVFGFASIFNSLGEDSGDHFIIREQADDVGYWDMAYHSLITFSSVGYGDIAPKSPVARLVVSAEVLISMMINILFIAILFVYISNSQIFAAKRNEQLLEKKKHQLEEEKEAMGGMQKKTRNKDSASTKKGSKSRR